MRKKYYDDAKENLRDWIKNIQADCFWRSLACKRYQQYFDCMKAIVKNDTT